jgi:hypothetical protein
LSRFKTNVRFKNFFLFKFYLVKSPAVSVCFFGRFGNLYNSSGLTSGGFTGTVMYFDRISSSGKLKNYKNNKKKKKSIYTTYVGNLERS